jgi:hypothetical protein
LPGSEFRGKTCQYDSFAPIYIAIFGGQTFSYTLNTVIEGTLLYVPLPFESPTPNPN